jgi:DNA-binding response OmpR family regulator
VSDGLQARAPRAAVVDDEQDVLTFLRAAFEDRGFEVMTSDQPYAALPLLRRFRPDLVCLDLVMPEQSGVSLYLEMRRIPELSRVPVLILTGLDAGEALRTIEHDVTGVLPPDATVEKPLDLPSLFRAVDELLAGRGGGPP